MTGPVVGIVGAAYAVDRHWGTLPVTGAPRSYVAAVLAAGATPVVLPLGGSPTALALVDALVLTGGDDVGSDTERDAADLAVVQAAAGLGTPLLGVCRGLQLLAVAWGGRLGEAGASHIAPAVGHPVDTVPGSVVAEVLGASPHVSSIHHQVVMDPGPRLTVTARAADSAVEACEWTGDDRWQAVGVQWHPELDATGPALFGWLVSRCAQALARR